ncbi:uncharacterized protein LOC26528536 [Drosophila mojavensis]|uniref:Uncharacterized protein n=1 Tax=Drosophila mojavensis TaxID=7230 RepID=A0A0Q9XES8_DROMO|nr:uncharacterized protein LOC26528536 [Drosophila mojavensis]KRG07084.1 uncharacterized protein Dmoj_GI26895 [Drosophila mojavensis]
MGLTRKLFCLLLISMMLLLLPGVLAQIVDMEQQSNAAEGLLMDSTKPMRPMRALKFHDIKRPNAVVSGEGDYEDDDADGHKNRNGCDASDEQFIDPKQQNIYTVNINTVNMDDEEAKQMISEREFNQAIKELMKFDENTVADKRSNRIENGAGMDFRREFASDEANPYI